MRACVFLIRLFTVFVLGAATSAVCQPSGSLRGKVVLEANGDRLPHATVLIVQLGRTVETDAEGLYQFHQLPPGRYDVLAHMHPLTDQRRSVEIVSGDQATLDFSLRLAVVHEQVTVTATGREETTLEAFQAVVSLETLDLAPKAAASLGEALEHESGVAKRSFGPGTSRPVIRGFDGDRVSILQDGMATGTLSSQSGDHGEPVDASSVERIEVVRGPATLLYGTNALGGVVNIITGHHQVHPHAHRGVRGFLLATGGSNNGQGGGNGGFEIGRGKWMLFASGGGLRTGDYQSPAGTVENSHTDITHTTAGAGRFTGRSFFRFSYGDYRGQYGIPPVPAAEGHHDDQHEHAEGPVDEKWRRQNLRWTGGLQNLGAGFDRFTLHLNYSDWNHSEMVEGHTHTRFFNKQFSYRGVLDQRRRGPLFGSLGAQGLRRDYHVVGEEALTPPVTQDAFAVFALQQLSLDRFRLQLGGRLETNRYSPAERLPGRSFTGFSGSAGVNAALWRNGAVVASYSHSYRAPAVEELYNVGPHPGNMAYEVGNPELKRERSYGFETAVRHTAERLRGEVNLFYYRLNNYIYMEPTAEFAEGFVRANYVQADSRYVGAEARLDAALHRNAWLKLGFDTVDAQLRPSGRPLPRIPPARGRIGLDVFFKSVSVRPEIVLANAQNQLYTNETRTAGYVTGSLALSYTLTGSHSLQSFGVHVFNIANQLYRNHASLIKDFAPEIGRGVRFHYTVRFF